MDEDRPGPAPQAARDTANDGDPARARFWFIAAHRVAGVVLVILGFMAMQGKLDWGEGVGQVLAIVGLIDFFVVPLLFARMWRSVPK